MKLTFSTSHHVGNIREAGSDVRQAIEGAGRITREQCEKFGLKEFEDNLYTLLELLGKGAFGEVWRCLQKKEERIIVAIKYVMIEGKKQEDIINNYLLNSNKFNRSNF